MLPSPAKCKPKFAPLKSHLCITTTFPYFFLSKAFDKKKDRYSLLSPRLLEELRAYWRTYHPKHWLFTSRQNPHKPLLDGTAQCAFKQALKRARLPRKGGPHSLRHSWATHLVESGTPLHVVKRLLGHTSLTTTAGYLHISKQTLKAVQDPMDLMPWSKGSL